MLSCSTHSHGSAQHIEHKLDAWQSHRFNQYGCHGQWTMISATLNAMERKVEGTKMSVRASGSSTSCQKRKEVHIQGSFELLDTGG